MAKKPWNAQPGRIVLPELDGVPAPERRPIETVTVGHSTGAHSVARCPSCGSQGRGGPRLCDDSWHTRPRPGEVPMASVATTVRVDEPSKPSH